MNKFSRYWLDEKGLGTVEMVLILAVLVGIALIFRESIFGFVDNIVGNIFGGEVEQIQHNPLKP